MAFTSLKLSHRSVLKVFGDVYLPPNSPIDSGYGVGVERGCLLDRTISNLSRSLARSLQHQQPVCVSPKLPYFCTKERPIRLLKAL